MSKIKAGIVGGAGYTGGELIRILINHPGVDISFVHSNSNAGKFLYEVHADLLGETDLRFAGGLNSSIDVLFLCVGHGEAKKFLAENPVDPSIKIIDLSQDYRLKKHNETTALPGRHFVYGLPELNRAEIKAAQYVANPGCFATCIQLGLLPLAKKGILQEVNTTGITGSTGAGQSLNSTSHFSWRANNIQAYKTLTHQHLHEIGQSLKQLQPKGDIEIHFIPWRGDFTRGIFVSSQLRCDLPLEEIHSLYTDFYQGHPFVSISSAPVFLKQVVNTNRCILQLEKEGNRLVIHSVLDNLLKGASGQAVQNMNLMFGLDETEGLKLKAGFF